MNNDSNILTALCCYRLPENSFPVHTTSHNTTFTCFKGHNFRKLVPSVTIEVFFIKMLRQIGQIYPEHSVG
jgi:hypothetical protein